jgi:hypothetical protein
LSEHRIVEEVKEIGSMQWTAPEDAGKLVIDRYGNRVVPWNFHIPELSRG